MAKATTGFAHEVRLLQRRVLKRCDALLDVQVGPPAVDTQRIELYNRHKLGRELGEARDLIDAEGYRDFLVITCCDSFELRYRVDGRLIGIAITDRGESSLSAVYCYYDPAFLRLGIGTYSILKQLELCRRWGLRWLYLGLYIEDCAKMVYKGRFLPHERLLGGRWVRFER